MLYIEVALGITGYFLGEVRRQLEVIKKLNFSLNLGQLFHILNPTNKIIVMLSSCLCQSIINFVKYLREIDEREAKAEESWLLKAIVNM